MFEPEIIHCCFCYSIFGLRSLLGPLFDTLIIAHLVHGALAYDIHVRLS